MTTAINTTTETTNKVSNIQADAANIGRPAMVEHNGRLCYGIMVSVCLVGDNAVYGFITAWDETWCGCLVSGDRVTWCKTPEQKRLAMTAAEYYIACETESLKGQIAYAIKQNKTSWKNTAERQLADIYSLQKYIAK